MTLRIYNTLSRTKEEFTPLDPKNVRMYVCGPTVYDFAHIGNARPAIVFDVLFRLLRHLYGREHVTYVRNITDVDDKINARALRDHPGVPLNEAIRKVTETTYDQYQKDVAALGCLPPTAQPRATEYIPGMVEMITTLIKKGHAYEAGGEVLFDVSSMPDYGMLSGRKLEEQQAGARVAVEAHKKNPGDFVLWKLSSAEEPGWESPWGRGRPGWHIECSVMSKAALGEVFDIHGGGLDLIFPHHENEIAQSRCAYGTDVMANYWMHNGFLQVEGQKMSKSLGNFVTIEQLLNSWNGEPWVGLAVRLEMLGTHYLQPMDWTFERLTNSKATVQMLASLHRKHSFSNAASHDRAWSGEVEPTAAVVDPLCDDLNSPEAVGSIRERLSHLGKLDDGQKTKLVHDARYLGLISLGSAPYATGSFSLRNMAEELVNPASINFRDWRVHQANGNLSLASTKEAWFNEHNMDAIGPDTLVYTGNLPTRGFIERKIEDRLATRRAKDWKKSDEIRDQLLAMGIQIMDKKDPVTGELKTDWEVKR